MTSRGSLAIGLSTLAVALAPGPQDPPPPPASLAELRVRAGTKAFDMAWLYYSENRVDSEKVYRWSIRLLEARRDASVDRAGHVAACEEHRGRIVKLQAKVQRIRRIGFGDSLDVLETEYYAREADDLLDRAKAGR